jgi:hypothetical protein
MKFLCELTKKNKKDNHCTERNYVYNKLVTINCNLFYINFGIPFIWASNSYTILYLQFLQKIPLFVAYSANFTRHMKPNNIAQTKIFILCLYYSSFYPVFP